VLAQGTHPRGIGSLGQYLTPIMFAEGAARSLADELLWGIAKLCDAPGTDLATLKAVVAEMVAKKAGFFELFGLDALSETVTLYVETALAAKDKDELKRLTLAMASYVNRVHVWIDAAFPWGLCSGYMRPPTRRTTTLDAAS
jgi:hypothetical protein